MNTGQNYSSTWALQRRVKSPSSSVPSYFQQSFLAYVNIYLEPVLATFFFPPQACILVIFFFKLEYHIYYSLPSFFHLTI